MPQASWRISLLCVDVYPLGVPSGVKFVGVHHVGTVRMSGAVCKNTVGVCSFILSYQLNALHGTTLVAASLCRHHCGHGMLAARVKDSC